MKSLKPQIRRFQLLANKILIMLAFSSAIGIFSASTAFADHGIGHGLDIRHDGYGHRDHRFDDHFDYAYRYYDYGPGYGYQPSYRQPYIYSQPVYIPPPIYSPPPPSPGINLIFPLDLRHR
ncbi:MAG: hypothetical protein ACXV8O_15485 [Methylobacter sp.]